MKGIMNIRILFVLTALATMCLVAGVSKADPVHNWAVNMKPGTSSLPQAPHPFESDKGWGGGAKPHQLIDGYRGCDDKSGYACGLAFTGGEYNWGGEQCGIRQATITLPKYSRVRAVKITHHGDNDVPKIYEIQAWKGGQWTTVVAESNNSLARCIRPSGGRVNCMIVDEFPKVWTKKVRYKFNNCPENNESIVPGKEVEHGWLYEFEVYNLP